MQDKATNGAVYELVLRRLSRRDFLVGGSVLAASGVVGCSPETGSAPSAAPGPSVFATIAGSAEDAVIVPEGFAADVLIRWGDPVVSESAGLSMGQLPTGSLLAAGAAEAQASAFGCSADGMGVIPVADDRLVICINHETPETSRMFPGYGAAARERKATEFLQEHPETVAVMRASVGVSVVEFERIGDRWQFVGDSPLNRRITADTPIEFSGPAAHHPWLDGSETEVGHCLGTFGNCAAGSTPWGTYLTAEENTNNFFGNAGEAEWEPLLERANDRFGMLNGASTFRWEVVDERFDHAKHPAESMKFGWIVEIDPLNPDEPVKKRTALGKFRHEGAETVLNGQNRPVVYMGDDSGFEYLYKFVSDGVYDPTNPGATDELLDVGTLFAARLDDDGNGEWLPLVHGEHPELTEANEFFSQADVVMRCREAADLVGATPLDRPEDVAVHPHNGLIYLSCTQGTQRGQRPPRRPQGANAGGGPAAAAGARAGGPGPAAATGTRAGGPGPAAATGTRAGGPGPAAAAGTRAGGPGPAAAAGTRAGGPGSGGARAGGAGAPDGGAVAEAAPEPPRIPAPDAANPRGPNPYGHILEFSEAGGDAAATRFTWDVFLLAGDPSHEGLASVAIVGRLAPAVAYYAGRSDSAGLSAFANPDNLGFDAAGNLWIVTDGSQPNDNNNGCFVCPTEGPDRGMVRQFMSGPVGAEISGCTFAPDGESLFLTVQHPGGASSIEEPSSHWPDGGDAQPRSSLIAIRSIDPMRRFFA